MRRSTGSWRGTGAVVGRSGNSMKATHARARRSTLFTLAAAATIAVASAITGTATDAQAASPVRLELSWEAPEGCPDRAALVEEIERLVGHAVTAKEGGSAPESGDVLSVSAVVARAARGLSVSITSRSEGAAHDRRVEATTCKEAAEATALVVALALDPGLSTKKEGAGGDGAASGVAEDGAHRDGSPAVTTKDAGDPAAPGGGATKSGDSEGQDKDAQGAESTAPSPLRAEAHALFVLDAVALPAAAPGVAAGLGLWVGAYRFDVTGTLFAEQRQLSKSGGGGDIGLATGEIAASAAPLRGPLEVITGLGLEGGAIWGRGFGVQEAQSGTAPWVALRPQAVIGYSVWGGRVGASLGASLVIPLVRQRFLLGKEELFVPGVLSVRLLAGIFLRLP